MTHWETKNGQRWSVCPKTEKKTSEPISRKEKCINFLKRGYNTELYTNGQAVASKGEFVTGNSVSFNGLEKGTGYELKVTGVDDTAGPSMFPGKASFKTRKIQLSFRF